MTTQHPEAGLEESRIIKRYSNRKLYDTQRSKYVTLDEIAQMIKEGEEVRIIDNESKEDLTSVTLTQIIYEEEKRESRMPLSMLRNLIQTGGNTLQEFFDKSVKTPALEASKTVEKSVEDLRQSAKGLKDAATRSVGELTDSARRMLAERRADDFRKLLVAELDHLEQRLETRAEELAAEDAAHGERTSERDVRTDLRSAHHVDKHVELLRERITKLNAVVDRLDGNFKADGD